MSLQSPCLLSGSETKLKFVCLIQFIINNQTKDLYHLRKKYLMNIHNRVHVKGSKCYALYRHKIHLLLEPMLERKSYSLH